MDFFQMFANMVIPKWVKAVIALVLFALLGMNIFLGYFGLSDHIGNESWVAAAANLLGILLPILIIAFVLMYVDGGTKGLRIKTYDYMTKTIPDTLVSIVEEPGAYYNPKKTKGPRINSEVQVFSNQYRGSCIGNYIIKFPNRLVDEGNPENKKSVFENSQENRSHNKMHVSLELNVRKANVSVRIPACEAELAVGLTKSLDEFKAGEENRKFSFKHFKTLFPHTLQGSLSEGYIVNENIGYKKIGECYYYRIVFIKVLDDKFLINAQEKLYFAQDMMFMLKAFYNEKPGLFVDNCKETLA